MLLCSWPGSNLFSFLKLFLGLLWHNGPTFIDVMLVLLVIREANKVSTLTPSWCHLGSVNSRSVRLGHHVWLICPNGSFWSLSHLFFLSPSAHDLIGVGIRDFKSHFLDVKIGAELFKVDVVDPPYSNVTIIFDWARDVWSDSMPLFYFDSRALLFGILLNSLHVMWVLLDWFDTFGPHITLILINVGIISEVAIVLRGVDLSLNLEFSGISLHLGLYWVLLFVYFGQGSVFLILWHQHHVVSQRDLVIRVLGREDSHMTWTPWNWNGVL